MKSTLRKRIPVILDGEVVSVGGVYTAIINNISEHGIYAKIPLCEKEESLHLESDIFSLKLKLPTGHLVNLNCRKRWSYHMSPASFIEHVGMEIIEPPEKYVTYFRSMIFRHFKWH